MGKAAQIEVENPDTEADDDTIVDDELDTDTDPEDDTPEKGDESDDEGDEGASDDEGADTDEADELVVSIGGESQAADDDQNRAPEWVRELRKSNREKDRRIRELEQQVTAKPGPQAVVVGDKPTLESYDYDAEKFERDLEAWHTRKREADEQQRARAAADEQLQKQWQSRIDAVTKASTELKVKDSEDAAQAFDDTFSIVQRGIVLGGPDDPKASALLRYALGKNPKKAKELAAINDPVKFTYAVAKLETQLKVTPRKTAPTPDRAVRSSVAGASSVDNQLERLRTEAAKTGDFSKVHQYRQQLKAKDRK